MKNVFTPRFLLRIGVAFTFAYPAISAWFAPYSWIGYFPGFMLDAAGPNDELMLHAFGLLELVIAVWLLWGKKLLIPSSIAAVILFLIIIFNLAQIDVLFRDIPILLMAGILILLEQDEKLPQQ